MAWKTKLRTDVVRGRMDDMGLTQEKLTELVARAREDRLRDAGKRGRAGKPVTLRTVQNWLGGGTVGDSRDVLAVAEALGRGLEDVAETVPPLTSLFREAAGAGEASVRRALDLLVKLGAIPNQAPRFSYYFSRFALDWPLRGYVRAFEHAPTRPAEDQRPTTQRHCYVEIIVRPTQVEQSFTLAYTLGPVCVEFTDLARSGDLVRSEEVFTNGRGRAQVVDGAFKVWTWFGGEGTRFLVRSSSDFKMSEPRVCWTEPEPPGNAPPDAIILAAARHHAAAARKGQAAPA